MPYKTFPDGTGMWFCEGCGLIRDTRPSPRGPLRCTRGHLVDDGLEFQRALDRGDETLWNQMAREEWERLHAMTRARALQAAEER